MTHFLSFPHPLPPNVLENLNLMYLGSLEEDKVPGVVVGTCKPSTWEGKAGGSGVQDQPELFGEFSSQNPKISLKISSSYTTHTYKLKKEQEKDAGNQGHRRKPVTKEAEMVGRDSRDTTTWW